MTREADLDTFRLYLRLLFPHNNFLNIMKTSEPICEASKLDLQISATSPIQYDK